MRYPDWPARLSKYFLSVKDSSFSYGEFDCCIFISDAVVAMTGVDQMGEFRGKYTDKDSSIAALKEYGSGNLYKTLVKKFGRSVPGVQGRRGDIGYAEGSCGIITGTSGVFLRDGGFMHVPLTMIQRSFRVN